uniref:Uncharacterized protein n=1 Tax=Oryzias latipes TaxID=8090 RepID=A0A3P9KAV4_ORYLA
MCPDGFCPTSCSPSVSLQIRLHPPSAWSPQRSRRDAGSSQTRLSLHFPHIFFVFLHVFARTCLMLKRGPQNIILGAANSPRAASLRPLV